MKPDSVYGFAKHGDVEAAITKRLNDLKEGDVMAISTMLGEAVLALLEVNESIPVQSKHRHLIANALEIFADGPIEKNPHTQPTG